MAVYECGTGGSVFAEIAHGVSDGFKFDTKDTVWTSTARDVSCYAPVGTLLGEIRIPETVSNQSFGGAKRRRLFITATTSLYALYVGARKGSPPRAWAA